MSKQEWRRERKEQTRSYEKRMLTCDMWHVVCLIIVALWSRCSDCRGGRCESFLVCSLRARVCFSKLRLLLALLTSENCFWNTISSFVTRTFFVTSWQSPDSSVSSSWLSSNPSICHRDAPEESSIRAAVFIIVERLTWHIWRNLDSELSMRRFGFTRSRRKVTCTVIGSWRRWVICKEVMLDKWC